VFTGDRDRDGITDIYVRRTDGSVRKLTFNRVNDRDPAWSTDGRKIAFARDVGLGVALFVMNADGSNVRQLTRPVLHPTGFTTSDLAPAWSPDGRRIAFISNRVTGDQVVWRMNSDGRQLTRLTRTPGAFDYNPTWSPDGRRIWFDSTRLGSSGRDIFTMRPDGTGVRRMTRTAHDDWSPDVSPDGRRVVFSRNDANGFLDLWRMRTDGSGARKLLTGPEFMDEVNPRWTADGSRILYVLLSPVDPNIVPEIWRVNGDGTGKTQITSGLGFSGQQPDPYPVRRR
jgi:TolB protein